MPRPCGPMGRQMGGRWSRASQPACLDQGGWCARSVAPSPRYCSGEMPWWSSGRIDGHRMLPARRAGPRQSRNAVLSSVPLCEGSEAGSRQAEPRPNRPESPCPSVSICACHQCPSLQRLAPSRRAIGCGPSSHASCGTWSWCGGARSCNGRGSVEQPRAAVARTRKLLELSIRTSADCARDGPVPYREVCHVHRGLHADTARELAEHDGPALQQHAETRQFRRRVYQDPSLRTIVDIPHALERVTDVARANKDDLRTRIDMINESRVARIPVENCLSLQERPGVREPQSPRGVWLHVLGDRMPDACHGVKRLRHPWHE